MVGDFFRKAKDFVTGGNDNPDIRPASEDPYGDPADQQSFDNPLPASQDPYGDPAGNYGQYGNVTPASQDPYGDPADQQSFDNPLPASQDPYGDPAGNYGDQYGDNRGFNQDPYVNQQDNYGQYGGDGAERPAYGDRPMNEDPYGDPADGNYPQ